MTAPFIVIDTYTIKEGKLEDFRQFLQELFDILEANEPRLLAINEDGTEVAVVQVHQDAASIKLYWQVVHQHTGRAFRQFVDATTNFQVSGTPSDAILKRARQYAQSGVTVNVNPDCLGGFTRLVAAAAEPAAQ